MLEHRAYLELEDFYQAERRVEEWTLFATDAPPRRWRLVADPTRPVPAADAEVPEVPIDDLPRTPGVPHVLLNLPPELWVVNLVADAQLELLRKRCALSWAIDRVCFAMLVLYTAAKKPVGAMGAGYFMQLTREDRLEYPAPPSTPFDVIGVYIASLKDEMYRVVTQMAAGVDNNAAAIGRSGESKLADGASTEIVLRALGLIVRDALERSFELGAQLLGTPADFRLGGLDTFQVTSARELFELASGIETLGSRSPTLERELQLRLARRALPDASAETLAAIEKELSAVPLVNTASADVDPDAPPGDLPGLLVPPGAEVTKAADTALNGAQITSLREIVMSAAVGEIPRESALALILAGFPAIDQAEADRILGPIGRGFVPAPDSPTTPTLGAARPSPPTTGGAGS